MTISRRSWWLLFIGLFSAPSLRADISCEEINRLWQERYSKDIQISPPPGVIACPSPTAKVVRGLYNLETARFDGDRLPTTNLMYDYFVKFAKKINLTTKDYPGLDAETTLGHWNRENNEVVLGKVYFDANNEAATSEALVHEAAHAESRENDHQPCIVGMFSGSSSCDNGVREDFSGGAYSRSVFALRAFILNSRRTQIFKDMAIRRLDFILRNMINRVDSPEEHVALIERLQTVAPFGAFNFPPTESHSQAVLAQALKKFTPARDLMANKAPTAADSLTIFLGESPTTLPGVKPASPAAPNPVQASPAPEPRFPALQKLLDESKREQAEKEAARKKSPYYYEYKGTRLFDR